MAEIDYDNLDAEFDAYMKAKEAGKVDTPAPVATEPEIDFSSDADFEAYMKSKQGQVTPTTDVEGGTEIGKAAVEGTKAVARTTAKGAGAILVTEDKQITPEQYENMIDDEEKLDIINEARERGVTYKDIIKERTDTENLAAAKAGEIDPTVRAKRWVGKKLMQVGETKLLEADEEFVANMNFIEKLAYTGPQVVGQIAAAVATGGVGGALLMGAQITGGTYENLIAQGVDHDRAASAGIVNALIQAPLESIGIGKASKFFNLKSQIAKKLKKLIIAAGTEGVTEGLQEVPEYLVNLIATNPDKKVLEAFNQMLSDPEFYKGAAESAALGGVLGGGVSTTGIALRKVYQQMDKIAAEDRAAKTVEEDDVTSVEDTELQKRIQEDAKLAEAQAAVLQPARRAGLLQTPAQEQAEAAAMESEQATAEDFIKLSEQEAAALVYKEPDVAEIAPIKEVVEEPIAEVTPIEKVTEEVIDTRPEVIPGEVPAIPPPGRSGMLLPDTKGEMIDLTEKETVPIEEVTEEVAMEAEVKEPPTKLRKIPVSALDNRDATKMSKRDLNKEIDVLTDHINQGNEEWISRREALTKEFERRETKKKQKEMGLTKEQQDILDPEGKSEGAKKLKKRIEAAASKAAKKTPSSVSTREDMISEAYIAAGKQLQKKGGSLKNWSPDFAIKKYISEQRGQRVGAGRAAIEAGEVQAPVSLEVAESEQQDVKPIRERKTTVDPETAAWDEMWKLQQKVTSGQELTVEETMFVREHSDMLADTSKANTEFLKRLREEEKVVAEEAAIAERQRVTEFQQAHPESFPAETRAETGTVLPMGGLIEDTTKTPVITPSREGFTPKDRGPVPPLKGKAEVLAKRKAAAKRKAKAVEARKKAKAPAKVEKKAEPTISERMRVAEKAKTKREVLKEKKVTPLTKRQIKEEQNKKELNKAEANIPEKMPTTFDDFTESKDIKGAKTFALGARHENRIKAFKSLSDKWLAVNKAALNVLRVRKAQGKGPTKKLLNTIDQSSINSQNFREAYEGASGKIPPSLSDKIKTRIEAARALGQEERAKAEAAVKAERKPIEPEPEVELTKEQGKIADTTYGLIANFNVSAIEAERLATEYHKGRMTMKDIKAELKDKLKKTVAKRLKEEKAKEDKVPVEKEAKKEKDRPKAADIITSEKGSVQLPGWGEDLKNWFKRLAKMTSVTTYYAGKKMDNFGESIRRIHSIRTLHEGNAIDLATTVEKDTKRAWKALEGKKFFYRGTKKPLKINTLDDLRMWISFVANDTKLMKQMPTEIAEVITKPVNDLRLYFEMANRQNTEDGLMDLHYLRNEQNRLEDAMIVAREKVIKFGSKPMSNAAVRKARANRRLLIKLKRRLKRVMDDISYIAIPTELLSMSDKDMTSSQKKRAKRLRFTMAKKRKSLSMKDAFDLGILLKEDVAPSNVLLAYGRNYGQARSMVGIRDALIKDGQAIAQKEKPKNKEHIQKKILEVAGKLSTGVSTDAAYKKLKKEFTELKGQLTLADSKIWVKAAETDTELAKSVMSYFDEKGKKRSMWITMETKDIIEALQGPTPGSNVAARTMQRVKMATFFKPWYMPTNDIVQALTLGGALLHPYAHTRGLIDAFTDLRTRNAVYQRLSELAGFSQPHGNNVETLRDINKRIKNGTISESEVYSFFHDRIKSAGLNVKDFKPVKAYDSLMSMVWDLAWTGDQLIRLSTYNGLKRRGYSDEAAAKHTARAHADYADVPVAARRASNKVVYTPTYTISMIKQMISTMASPIRFTSQLLTPGVKVSERNKMELQGLLSVAATLGALDLLMVGFLGWERDEFGRKYTKEVDTEMGPKTETINVTMPINKIIKYHYMVKDAAGEEFVPGMNMLMNRLSWELTPAVRIAMNITEGIDAAGNPVFSQFDDSSVKAFKGAVSLLRDIAPITKVGSEKNIKLRGVSVEESKRIRKDLGNVFKIIDLLGFTHLGLKGQEDAITGYKMRKLRSKFRMDYQRAIENDVEIDEEAWIRNYYDQINTLAEELND
jgi:hypothetical protein